MKLRKLLEVKDFITFDAKNTKEIMKLLGDKGFKTNQEENGKLTVIIDNKDVTIFKGDTIEFKDGTINIVKPNI